MQETGFTDRQIKPLSKREKEIAILLTKDQLSSKETASKLFISVKTVEKHRQKLYWKLKVHNVLELLIYAIKDKWFTIDEIILRETEHVIPPEYL